MLKSDLTEYLAIFQIIRLLNQLLPLVAILAANKNRCSKLIILKLLGSEACIFSIALLLSGYTLF
jgi:hypothetical protein